MADENTNPAPVSTAVADNLSAQTNPDAKPVKGKDMGPKVPVRLLHDTWDADGKRHPAGVVVELPLEAAKTLIAEKKADRADPLPGEK